MIRFILPAVLMLASLAGAQDRIPKGDFSGAERAAIRKIFRELASARSDIAEAERLLLDLVLSHEGDPVRPPIDPPIDPPPVDPPATGWPDLPFYVPPIPAYDVPTIRDCDWTIEDGIASSTRGLEKVAGLNSPIAEAYRRSIAAGHSLPITIGIWDDGGRAVPGGLWNPHNEISVCIDDGAGGWLDIELELVGLDDSCEVALGWSKRWGGAGYIGAFNIGLRGSKDSFIIRANEGIGRLIIDGCWWLPNMLAEGMPQNHASAMHIDKWETLIWQNHQFRGLLPSDPGTLVREHSGYLKSCVGTGREGGTWIVGNDLRGGNRTGFQLRPQPSDNPRPMGPIVIANNYADGYGWTHGDEPISNDGGACMTAWVGPESPVYVFGNRITDARYACFTVSGQAPDRNWLSQDGFPVQSVHVYGNTFENARADRGTVSLSATGAVHLYENQITGGSYGELAIDSAWNWKINQTLNGTVSIYGQEVLDQIKAMDVRTYDPDQPGKAVPMDPAVLESYLVPVATGEGRVEPWTTPTPPRRPAR